MAFTQTVRLVEDTTIEIDLAGAHPQEKPVWFSTVQLPKHGSFEAIGARSQDVTRVESDSDGDIVVAYSLGHRYAPEANFSGVDSLIFTVTDGELTAAQKTVRIEVLPINDRPILSVFSDSVVEEDAGVQEVQFSAGPGGGADEEGQVVTVKATSSNSDLIVDPTVVGQTLRYAPVPDSSGTARITVVADDGQAANDTTVAEFTVTVTAVEDAPTANDQTVSTFEDTTLTVTLSGHDPEGANLTYSMASPPSNGTIDLADDKVTYNPDPEFSGEDRFAFTASDGALTSVPASVSIVVVEVIDPAPPTPAPLAPADGAVDESVDQEFVWGDVENAVAYTVQLSEDSGFGDLLIDSTGVSMTSLMFAGLNTSTVYHWRVRAVGADSSSGWSPVQSLTTFTPDLTPPGPPADLKIIGLEPGEWSVNNTVMISMTEPEDESGIARIYYKVGDVPSAGDDTTSSVPSGQQIELTLMEEGEHTVHVWLVDSAGNVDHSQAQVVTARYDATPPSIVLPVQESQTLGNDLSIAVEIADVAPLLEVTLHYRVGGSEEFTAVPMAEDEGNFSAVVPGADVGYRGLQYYVIARDSAGNASTLPLEGEASPIDVRVSFEDFAAEKPAPVEMWSLVSVPAKPNNGSPLEVLRDLGAYDNTQWRLFRYFQGQYREFGQAEIGDFEPGLAFWLI